jgi:hypothetical protein
MKENHTTAVLVQDQGQITGIFTSKDVVLRVIAPDLDPANCSVIRVMTPHPDFAPLDMSIQQALRKMHDGHYLNLPVMNKENDEIVGMVDVLKLTYATLDQINGMSTGDNEGPAWNKFWMSMDHGETESMMSGDGGSHLPPLTPDHRSGLASPDHGRERIDNSVLPGDSASHHGAHDPDEQSLAGPVEDIPFTFKFKAPSGRVHRLQVVASAGLSELITAVASKLGNEVDGIGGVPTYEDSKISPTGFALSYMDNEGDSVSITTDHDLLEAITMARQARQDKVDLYVHDPEKPAVPVAPVEQTIVAPAPATPVETLPKLRRRHDADGAEDEEDAEKEEGLSKVQERRRERKATSSAAQQPAEQIIQGVPNDLLLPGAVVILAVVVVITFTLGRSSR